MSKPSRRPATRPAGEPAGGPSKPRDLLSKWWVQLLVAAWLLAVVTIYFRLQLLRMLEIATRRP